MDVTNFRSLKQVSIRDNGRLTIIIGYNEAGKSSLCNAIKYAFTGEAYGHRGPAAIKLVSYGEHRMSTFVKIGTVTANRATASGDSVKEIAARLSVSVETLPLLFDPKLCGDGGNNHMRAFLNGVGSNRFNALVTFQKDTDVLPFVELAMRAGKNDAKAIITFCEANRAAQKAPPRPVAPSTLEVPEAQLTSREANVKTLELQIADNVAKQNEIRALSIAASNIAQYMAQMDDYEAKKKVASVGDPLADRRATLTKLLACQDGTLTYHYEVLLAAGVLPPASLATFHAALGVFETAKAETRAVLLKHPLPPAMPTTPVLPASAKPLWDKLCASAMPNAGTVAKITADAVTRDAELQQILDQLRGSQQSEAMAVRTGRQSQGAWNAYRAAQPNYDRDVLNAEAEWARWDHAIKAITKAEMEYLNSSADVFAQLVTDMGDKVLQGRKIRIDRDDGVFLDTVPIAECSESTMWRMEVIIMAAIGRLLKAPILIIDRADVCDIHNRAAITGFLMQHIVPHFQHCLLTMTPSKTLEEEPKLPPGTIGASKWILSGGSVMFHSGESPDIQDAPRPPPPPPSMESMVGGYNPPPLPRSYGMN